MEKSFFVCFFHEFGSCSYEAEVKNGGAALIQQALGFNLNKTKKQKNEKNFHYVKIILYLAAFGFSFLDILVDFNDFLKGQDLQNYTIKVLV